MKEQHVRLQRVQWLQLGDTWNQFANPGLYARVSKCQTILQIFEGRNEARKIFFQFFGHVLIEKGMHNGIFSNCLGWGIGESCIKTILGFGFAHKLNNWFPCNRSHSRWTTLYNRIHPPKSMMHRQEQPGAARSSQDLKQISMNSCKTKKTPSRPNKGH